MLKIVGRFWEKKSTKLFSIDKNTFYEKVHILKKYLLKCELM